MSAVPELGQRIVALREELAHEVTERHFARRPELAARFGEAGRAYCREDAKFHLDFLAEAVALGVPQLFVDYLVWGVAMLASRGIDAEDLIRDVAELARLLHERFPEWRDALDATLEPGRRALEGASTLPPAAALPPPAMRYFEAARQDPLEASAVVDDLLNSGMTVSQLYVQVLQQAMHEAGRRWQANEFSVADEHYFTAVTQRITAKVYSDVFLRRGRAATVVVACVPGELHELGARMVSDLLELEGFRCHYLGASMPPRAIVDFACMHQAKVLALSVSFPPHLRAARNAIEWLRADPRARAMKVVVGGRAFDAPGVWRAIGADGWAADAAGACAEVRRLAGQAV